MFYYPLLGALALATGTILQKQILKRKKISINYYFILEFLVMALVMLPLIYFFWEINPEAFELKNILIFLSVIFFSIIANLFVYYSMKWEKVSNLEPAKVLEPLFVIILAIFFSYIFGTGLFERNTKVIIPALIAAGALVFSHIEKHHLDFNKYFLAAILGSFLFALELVISKLIIDYYSALTFYFLRVSTILLITLLLFRPKFTKLNSKLKSKMLMIGISWVIYRIIIYYGYQKLGVVFTTLVLMLGPIFIYLFAWKFLKEKITWRNITASFIIVACVVYALLV